MEKRQNWNMEFKDATSAAQAAAESAEQAALAARAAARFSNQEKIANHHSTGPHVSDSRDKPPHFTAPSGSSGESSLDDQKPKISNQHIDHTRHDTESFDRSNNDSVKDDRKPKISDQHTDESQHDASQKANERFDSFNNDSIEEEKLVNNFHKTDVYYEESLHEDQEGFSSPERESETKLSSGQKDVIEDENINLFATENQSTIHSAHSHSRSRSSGNEVDVGKKSVVGNPFAVVDQQSPFKTDVYDEAVSDDNDNDDGGNGPRFDTGFEYDEMEATHSLENAYIWNPKMNTVDKPISQSHIFSESLSFGDQSVKSVEPAETDNHAPATFDHSDGPDSESESELLSMNPEPSSVVESSQTYNSRKNRIELNDLVEEGPSFEDDEKQMHTQLEFKNHNLDQESSDTLEDNNDSPNQQLNFGKLTGGLKHKGGFKYPPYTKSATNEKSTEESSLTGSQTSLRSSLDSKASRREDTKPKVPIHISDSDEKASRQTNTRSRFPPPAAFFDDDEETDSEDEVPKQVPIKARLGSGLSRRTRGSPSVSYSKTHVEPKPNPEPEPMPETVIPVEPRAYARRLKVEDDKQNFESQQPNRRTVETGKIRETTSEPQVNHSAHTKQEHTSSRITVDSGKLKNAKTQDLGSEKLKENAVKKPSHVHPKLPEYDSLAARLQSLRADRQ